MLSLWTQNLELREREGSEELGQETPQQLSEEDGPGLSAAAAEGRSTLPAFPPGLPELLQTWADAVH